MNIIDNPNNNLSGRGYGCKQTKKARFNLSNKSNHSGKIIKNKIF